MKLNGFPVEKRKLSDLVKANYNPRQITPEAMTALQTSLKEFGTVEPIVVNKTTGNVVGGHQRLDALLTLGEKETDVVIVEIDADREKVLNLALNKISGEWDDDKLREVLNDLGGGDLDLALTGFSEEEIEELLGIADYEGLTDEDEVPEEVEPVCKTGELWLLGEHRLLCGDSTKAEDVERLMDGQASILITDPPYNIGFASQRSNYKQKYTVVSDKLSDDEYVSLLSAAIIESPCEKKIVTCGKQNLQMWFSLFDINEVAIWIAMNKMSGGLVSNLSLFEPIVFIGKFDRHKRANDIFEFSTSFQKEADSHPCPKPVALFSEFIRYYSDKSTYDPFLGSGTTLIACEKLNRKCYGMEIDPHYCDVVISRWERFAGKRAKRINA